MAIESEIMGRIEQLQPRLVKLTQDLIKEKSVNPPGDETGPARVLTNELTSLGLQVRQIEAAPKRINVEAILQGAKTSPVFLFNGHTDVVAEGDHSRWSVDPFGGVVKGGRIYGRGASDMKGGLASVAIALRSLVDSGIQLKGSVKFHAVADEEVNADYGTAYMVKEGLARADMGIVAEGSVFEERIVLRTAVRGNVWVKVTTRGKAAHASNPREGVNAVLNMSKLLIALSELKLEHKPHPILPAPTISPGTVIKGGQKTNIIPEYCEAETDVRLVPGMTDTDVLRQFQFVIDELKKQDPNFEANVEEISYVPAVEIDQTSPIVAIARETTRIVAGYDPKFHASFGTNDSFHLIQSGVPVMCGFGPGSLDTGNAHGPDENVKISDLSAFAKIYALSVVKALGIVGQK